MKCRKERWDYVYKLNLKTNPELARQRHNEQNREWYKRNKDKVIEQQRKRRQNRRQQNENNN